MILKSEKRRLAGIDCDESKAPSQASKAPSRLALAVTSEGLRNSLSSGSYEKVVDLRIYQPKTVVPLLNLFEGTRV
jgi:hypothetical protein